MSPADQSAGAVSRAQSFTSVAELAGSQLKLAIAGEAFRPPPRVRAVKQYAEWRRGLEKALSYLKDRHPEQARELIDEFERRMAEGPDFIRTRPKSEERDAPMVDLDRNARAKVMLQFRTLARKSWLTKTRKKHRGAITRVMQDVFEALLYLAAKYGRVFPSLLGLGHLARCCKDSVVAALDALEALGFITRIRRTKRVATPLGDRVVQTTNAYLIHPPATALGRLAVAMFSSESDYPPASEAKVFSLSGATPVPSDDRDAATIRREALQRETLDGLHRVSKYWSKRKESGQPG